jgi:hypothetical protein
MVSIEVEGVSPVRKRLKEIVQGHERGSGLLEMAVVIPLLLLLLVGVVDFGRAFHYQIVITNAAREGARYGSHFPHLATGIRDTAKQEAVGSAVVLDDTDILITPEPPAEASPGESIWVGVEYNYDTIMGGFVGMENLTLRSAAVMVVFGQN